MNEFSYTDEQGIELLDKLLLPKGYEKYEDKHGPVWFKIHDSDERDWYWMVATITLDLESFVKPEIDTVHGLFVKSYGELYGSDGDITNFITLLQEAEADVKKDLDEVFKVFQETFTEKKPDNIYTLVNKWDDYGEFDEDGIPGVETTSEEEYDSLEEALKDFYACVSFNEEVELYRGNKEITYDVLEDESLFKTYYNNKEVVLEGDFQHLTYEQAWECVKEYTEEGYSELLHDYRARGIIR